MTFVFLARVCNFEFLTSTFEKGQSFGINIGIDFSLDNIRLQLMLCLYFFNSLFFSMLDAIKN